MSYTFDHPEGKGLGEHHGDEAGRAISAEMRDLDMPSGTPVEIAGTDEDTGAVIVAWTGKGGTLRHTAVQPDFFAEYFKQDEGA